ncbi:hypothetical protein H6F43_17320 [Leptolyngbya sp. FACHB-36]|uniref:hypothetical protein n=1 Tax=Leptolyngbya sp. FACHB-36 TaxID=2692808 RepID=UPI001680C178|nr:hypothetical protein [Leptolyngbya sp. FACHB-36]MBD2021943.1 hypothetical protein [Leptolyngbya sp. FACHB-36]
MNNPIVTLFLLGIFLLLIVSPFSLLAIVMLFLAASLLVWMVSIVVGSLFSSRNPQKQE